MRHATLLLQLALALFLFQGCKMFGDKKSDELSPAQLEQARQYMAANPNGPAAPIRVADRAALVKMADKPAVKELLKSNPVYRDYVAKQQKLAAAEKEKPVEVSSRQPEVRTQRYLGSGAR